MREGPLVVIGDTLLDVDLMGVAERLSPEAPVPVVDCRHERYRAGGAGLAATLAAGLTDGEVTLITALGDDRAGGRLRDLLRPYAEVLRLPLGGSTACKVRVHAGGQSLVRLDTGDGELADVPDDPALVSALRGAGAVLVSDYGRGVTSHAAIRALLGGLPREVPMVWDPHPGGAPPLSRALIVTPNRAEARTLARRAPYGTDTLREAAQDAAALVRRWGVDSVAVTLGERGALLAAGDRHPFLVPASRPTGSSRADTCGAGDCFAATATHALLRGAQVEDAVVQAVRGASGFVASGGAAAVPTETEPRDADCPSPWEVVERVRERGGCVVATGGCFDLLHAGHVSLLREARRLGDCLVVCLNSDASVRALKGPDRPLVPAGDRARVLCALECVDAVAVFDELTPVELLGRLRPHIWVKGADYSGTDLVEAGVVRRHGGEVVLLPSLDGRSTSRLLERARQASHG
jgi:D-beta-D-heptose 7-phosphate kinase / D-beta-D-heptose 1-phosphate adenosyltransferase